MSYGHKQLRAVIDLDVIVEVCLTFVVGLMCLMLVGLVHFYLGFRCFGQCLPYVLIHTPW